MNNLSLKEYNILQVQCIIDKYKHEPNQEEILLWVKEFAKKYREICEAGYCDLCEIEEKLYGKNKES